MFHSEWEANENRLSFGVQWLCKEKLATLNRSHSIHWISTNQIKVKEENVKIKIWKGGSTENRESFRETGRGKQIINDQKIWKLSKPMNSYFKYLLEALYFRTFSKPRKSQIFYSILLDDWAGMKNKVPTKFHGVRLIFHFY